MTITTLLALFVPIMFLNLFGVWSNAYSALGDHLFIAIPIIFASLIGIAMRRTWPCLLAFLAVLTTIQFVFLAKAKPVNDWWSAYPAFTRTVGGFVLGGLFLAWYTKQSELISHTKTESLHLQ